MAKNTKSDSVIELRELFSAINRKDKTWWDSLNQSQQEKFSSWLYDRYVSSSSSSIPDMQRYFVMASNRVLNRNFNAIHKNHKKLQYLLMTTIPADGICSDYRFIKPIPQTKSQGKNIKLLLKLFPDRKIEDLEVLNTLLDQKGLEQLLLEHGWDEKEIKKTLK